jgi:nardilysin
VQQSDPCRLAQLRSHTANDGHLYRKFTWGNRKSLIEQPGAAGIDVRERLVGYYK